MMIPASSGVKSCFNIVINSFPALFGIRESPAIGFFDKALLDKFKSELQDETLVTFRVEIAARKQCPGCIEH